MVNQTEQFFVLIDFVKIKLFPSILKIKKISLVFWLLYRIISNQRELSRINSACGLINTRKFSLIFDNSL